MTTVLSTFSGAGGLDLGFAQAGYQVLWANDTDPHAKTLHDAVMQNPFMFAREPVHCTGDITAMDWNALPDADIIIGGPPCQGFSRAGLQDPDDPRRFMVFAFSAIVQLKRPRAFVMENVPNLMTGRRNRWVWQSLLRSLGEHYDLWKGVLDAYQFGVPQHRERVILVGLPKGEGRKDAFSRAVLMQVDNGSTVRETFDTLPVYGALGNDIGTQAKVTFARNPVLRDSPYTGMLLNGARPLNLDKPSTTLPAIMGGNKTPVIDIAVSDYGLERPWIEWYHEHLMSGGGPYRGEVNQVVRRITVQEAAALQTFPVSLPWDKVPMTAAYRLIGNAVPPAFARSIAKAVQYALA